MARALFHILGKLTNICKDYEFRSSNTYKQYLNSGVTSSSDRAPNDEIKNSPIL